MSSTEIRTSDLIGLPLDYAVSIVLKQLDKGPTVEFDAELGLLTFFDPERKEHRPFIPSVNWDIGGPITKEFKITWSGQSSTICRFIEGKYPKWEEFGSGYLIAAMRCLVAAYLGPVVQVPAHMAVLR